jgi:AcrR family transcriptional regulator
LVKARGGIDPGVSEAVPAKVLDERTSRSYLPIGMECSETMTKARGRPREFDPDQALAAALRVFWTRGYEGASMAELTEAMGITKPSLYACFGNKEALFRKALDLYERDKLAYIQAALEAPTARGVVERLLQGALSTHCGGSDPQGCLGVISMVAGTCEAASIRDHVVARRVSSEQALVARLARARDEGDLPAGADPKALAQCVTTVLGGLSVKAQGGTCPVDLRAVADTFLAMWPSA